MKTIAQQLNVTQFPYREFDKNNNEIYHEDSDGFWSKREYDENNNQIYYEDSYGFWSKSKFDEKDNRIYYENSNGTIVDNRPKSIQEYTMEELTKILGKPFKIVK